LKNNLKEIKKLDNSINNDWNPFNNDEYKNELKYL
jgi:hypothetical protein